MDWIQHGLNSLDSLDGLSGLKVDVEVQPPASTIQPRVIDVLGS